jgi:hypothetical protein
MFRRSWLVALVLMLAGCGTTNPSPTQPSAPPLDAPAAAPTARLAVSYDALFTGEATMGMTPITFDGSLSQGERLSYVIEFGDDARAEVATATHVIDQKGSFTARLTVPTGSDASPRASRQVGSFTDHTGLRVTSGGPAIWNTIRPWGGLNSESSIS